MKKNIAKMKKDIKSLVANQIITKLNRKTIKFEGERKMEPWIATMKTSNNREELRDHYIAYAILRFRNPIDHLGSKKLEDFFNVPKLLEKYTHEEVVCANAA